MLLIMECGTHIAQVHDLAMPSRATARMILQVPLRVPVFNPHHRLYILWRDDVSQLLGCDAVTV